MERNSRQIAVLLATYNGARFLREQLESLFRQTCEDFHLYVRDDGSTDDTLKIVGEFAQKYPDQVSVIDDGEGRLGAAHSFMNLLDQVDSEFYMFCDQDDVWLDTKIEKTLEHMLGLNQNMPVVVATDLQVVDENLNKIKDSFNADLKIDVFRKHPELLYVRHVVTGCTMMINEAAKNISLPFSPLATMHDEWIALCTHFGNGTISILDKATVLYRQHSANAVGAEESTKGFVHRVGSARGRSHFGALYKLVHEVFDVSLVQFLLYKIRFSWF